MFVQNSQSIYKLSWNIVFPQSVSRVVEYNGVKEGLKANNPIAKK